MEQKNNLKFWGVRKMSNNNKPENNIQNMPIFMCLGTSIGMSLGLLFDNIGVGMCLGVGIGTSIGALLDFINRKKNDDDTKTDEDKK